MHDVFAAFAPPARKRPRRRLPPAELRYIVVDGCWVWLGGRTKAGYGQITIAKRTMYAHRWFYERLTGPIPDGLVIDHLCENKGCVNPDHLEVVTVGENARRGQLRRRARERGES